MSNLGTQQWRRLKSDARQSLKQFFETNPFFEHWEIVIKTALTVLNRVVDNDTEDKRVLDAMILAMVDTFLTKRDTKDVRSRLSIHFVNLKLTRRDVNSRFFNLHGVGITKHEWRMARRYYKFTGGVGKDLPPSVFSKTHEVLEKENLKQCWRFVGKRD